MGGGAQTAALVACFAPAAALPWQSLSLHVFSPARTPPPGDAGTVLPRVVPRNPRAERGTSPRIPQTQGDASLEWGQGGGGAGGHAWVRRENTHKAGVGRITCRQGACDDGHVCMYERPTGGGWHNSSTTRDSLFDRRFYVENTLPPPSPRRSHRG